jgi:hypothetical protein
MHKKRLLLLSLLLVSLSLACVVGSSQLDPLFATLTPLSEAVKGTATARVADVGGPNDQLTTAIARATAQSANIYATQTARAGLNDESKLATATFVAPAVAELPRYGIEPSQGHVAWLHNPVTIDLNGYQQYGFANDYAQMTAADFVLVSDIKWYTFNSLSACGFMFRSDGNTAKPSQYMVAITRYATGYLGFTATVKGELSNMRYIYLAAQDNTFNWQNESTNRLAVVVRGAMIEAYTNGRLVATIDTSQPPPDTVPAAPSIFLPPNPTDAQKQDYQNQVEQNQQNMLMLQSQMAEARKNFAENKPIFSEGLLGFVGVSQSGQTQCTFSDAFLFIIER